MITPSIAVDLGTLCGKEHARNCVSRLTTGRRKPSNLVLSPADSALQRRAATDIGRMASGRVHRNTLSAFDFPNRGRIGEMFGVASGHLIILPVRAPAIAHPLKPSRRSVAGHDNGQRADHSPPQPPKYAFLMRSLARSAFVSSVAVMRPVSIT